MLQTWETHPVVAISSRDPYPLPLVLQSPIDPDPLQPLPAAGGEEQGTGAVAAATAVTTCDKCGEKYNLTIMAMNFFKRSAAPHFFQLLTWW